MNAIAHILSLPPAQRLHSRWRNASANLRGIAWMLLAGFCFTLIATLVKQLGEHLHPFQIIAFRGVAGMLFLAPILLRNGGALLRTSRPGMHLARAAMGVAAMGTTYYAYAVLPLAQVTALSFTTPLCMIVLAALFLGEPADWRRALATAAGFAGVLLIARPSGVERFDSHLWLAIASPFFIAGVRVIIARLTPTEATLTIVGRFSIAATLIMLPLGLWAWRDPTGMEWLMLAAVGVIATGAQSAMVRAYAEGEATVVTPFDYAKLLFAVALGFALFGEIPDADTITGAIVIVGSNFSVVLLRKPRERAADV
ncbi:DMT family transporter [Magnetofaba australis]|uniref:EamA domain-containing protein n=1 Tax=Magnetofaba australis IT-1 TaxID=1434232 RepID=A0A1Y2K674_9PROT|nr:DMT family transporter [Magnetofaba australis]OSM02515.1 hypothetical protein MAIT1_02666 [Magnetofaba australis IT-1]